MAIRFASPGSMNVDWEERWNVERLRSYRLARARAALDASELGAVLLFDFNNIRYVTSTHIGEWARDKMTRYALLTRGGDPHIWDFGSAAKHHDSTPLAASRERPRRDGRVARRRRSGRRPVPRRRARDPRHPPGRGRGRHADRRRHRSSRRCSRPSPTRASRSSTASRSCSTPARSSRSTRSCCSTRPARWSMAPTSTSPRT